jgi:hypothetical protein
VEIQRSLGSSLVLLLNVTGTLANAGNVDSAIPGDDTQHAPEFQRRQPFSLS